MAVFPPLLAPLFWERPGNVPALTRLLVAYLSKGGQQVVAGGALHDAQRRRGRPIGDGTARLRLPAPHRWRPLPVLPPPSPLIAEPLVPLVVLSTNATNNHPLLPQVTFLQCWACSRSSLPAVPMRLMALHSSVVLCPTCHCHHTNHFCQQSGSCCSRACR